MDYCRTTYDIASLSCVMYDALPYIACTQANDVCPLRNYKTYCKTYDLVKHTTSCCQVDRVGTESTQANAETRIGLVCIRFDLQKTSRAIMNLIYETSICVRTEHALTNRRPSIAGMIPNIRMLCVVDW